MKNAYNPIKGLIGGCLICFCLCSAISTATADDFLSYWQSTEELRIEGKVVSNEDQATLPGVTIREKGTTDGTITDVDGNYAIVVSTPDAVLEFSYVGFRTQEIPVNNRTTIDVVLEEDVASLEEVVVVGYSTQKKKDLTGAIATLKTEDFAPGTNTNAAQLLTGAAAGVNVSQVSSAPAAASKCRSGGQDPSIVPTTYYLLWMACPAWIPTR